MREGDYQFKAGSAKQFQKHGVLVSDSAHVTPPFAGQGLVLGLKDALNLSWKLDHCLKKKTGKKILETYTLERKPEVNKMITLAIVAGFLTSPQTKLASFLSESLFFTLSRFPLLKGFIRRFQFKPNHNLKKGFLVKRKWLRPSFIGKQFPAVWLKKNHDSKRVRSDELLGGRFCLFCLEVDPDVVFGKELLKKWGIWGGQVVK